MHLSFSVATSAMILLEYHRYFCIWPLGDRIQPFLILFTDSKDTGPAILSHIYLIVGCALPVWIMGRNSFSPCMSGVCGIVSVCIGDSMVLLHVYARHL